MKTRIPVVRRSYRELRGNRSISIIEERDEEGWLGSIPK